MIKLTGFFKKSGHKLVIEAGSETLKWAVTEGSGEGIRMAEIGAFALNTDPKLITEKFAALIKRYRIEPQSILSCIPRYQATARNLELPSTQPAEIKKILDLQAVKQTPYAADEIVFDYYLLKAYREGYSSVMLVVAHRDVVNGHLRLLEDVGVKPSRITLATQCGAFWVSKQLRSHDSEVVGVLDIDVKYSDFFIYRGAHLLFTQNLSIGSEKLSEEGSKWQEKIAEEISRALQIYRSEEIAGEPPQIYYSGDASHFEPAAAKLETIIGSKPLAVPPPDEYLKIAEDFPGLSFSAVLGLALQHKPPLINLVPQEVMIRTSLVEKGRKLLITGALALLIFLLTISLFLQNYYRKQGYLRWLEGKTSVTQSPSEEVSTARKTIKDVLLLHDASLKMLQALALAASTIPNEIYFTEINLTKDNRFQAQGRAQSMTGVFDFINSLKQQTLFEGVETKRLTKRIVENKEIVDFEIESVLTKRPTAALEKLEAQLHE